MGNIKSIDVKVAIFFKRALNYYINKRTYKKPEPTHEEIWENLPFVNNELTHALNNTTNIILNQDSVLCKLIYFGFEKNEIDFVSLFLKEGDVFFDIGANIGLFSLYASKIVGQKGSVIAFEPTPETYRRLLKNLKSNNCYNVKTFNIGLSDNLGVLNFNTSNTGHDAWNSFAKLNELSDSKTIEVEVDTLDDFIAKTKISNISLVKLDVEGWEKFVLKGACKLLESPSAPPFLVEFTEENAFAAGYYCGEVYDYLMEFGYSWYKYDRINNQLIKQSKQLHYPYENLIAIKSIENCIKRLENRN